MFHRLTREFHNGLCYSQEGDLGPETIWLIIFLYLKTVPVRFPTSFSLLTMTESSFIAPFLGLKLLPDFPQNYPIPVNLTSLGLSFIIKQIGKDTRIAVKVNEVKIRESTKWLAHSNCLENRDGVIVISNLHQRWTWITFCAWSVPMIRVHVCSSFVACALGCYSHSEHCRHRRLN